MAYLIILNQLNIIILYSLLKKNKSQTGSSKSQL